MSRCSSPAGSAPTTLAMPRCAGTSLPGRNGLGGRGQQRCRQATSAAALGRRGARGRRSPRSWPPGSGCSTPASAASPTCMTRTRWRSQRSGRRSCACCHTTRSWRRCGCCRAASAVAGREPADEPYAAHRRGHPDPPRHRRPGLLPTQASGRQDPRGGQARCLKRRISDAVYRQLLTDAHREAVVDPDPSSGADPGGHCGAFKNPARSTCPSTSTLRISHFPDPRTRRYNAPEELERPSPQRPSTGPVDNRGEPERRTVEHDNSRWLPQPGEALESGWARNKTFLRSFYLG